MKRIGGLWGYGLWVVVTSLILTEVVVRVGNLAPPLHDPESWLVEDTVLPYRPRPGSRYQGRTKSDEFDFDYRHNRFGFRDEDHPLDKPAGVRRIVGLGDSFTYGWGADYQHSYLRRIENALNAVADDQVVVEVVKLGIPGFDTGSEYLVWEHHGRHYSPDLVLIGVLANDVVDDQYGKMRLFEDRLVDSLNRKTAALMGRPGRWLYFRWESARLPLTWFARLRGRFWLPEELNWRRSFEDDGPFEEAWLRIEEWLMRFAVEIRSAGAEVLVVHIPQYLEDQFQDYAAERIVRWGERSGVAVVDTLPAFRQAVRSGAGPLFWEKDGHCTAAGYEVIAETVLERLESPEFDPGR